MKSVVLRLGGAMVVALAVLSMSGCGKSYSHDEFNALVMHKSEAEVKQVLGEPAWINDGKPAMWVYHGKTFDAANNKKDDKVSLTFGAEGSAGEQKVVDIRFD